MPSVAIKTADYVVTAADVTILGDASAGTVTFTLPTAQQSLGQVLTVKKVDATANPVVISPASGETVDGAATAPIYIENASLTIQSTGTRWIIL